MLAKVRELAKSRRFMTAVISAVIMLLVVFVPELAPVEGRLVDLIVDILSVF